MKPGHSNVGSVLVVAMVSLPLLCAAAQAVDGLRLSYPETKQIDVVDDYFGVKVPDPYRWLEDDNSAEVAAWVQAQNTLTFSYLEKIPYRTALKERLTKLYNYPKYSSPVHRGDWYFFSKNDGLQNQAVMYVAKGLGGTPEVLLDPNRFSTDGTSRLGAFSISRDGKYAAYGVSKGGSDWNEIFVLDVASRKTLSDDLVWIKASGVAWKDDGFFYSRYPAPEAERALTVKNEYQSVYFHKIGTAQSEDQLIYEDREHPLRFHAVATTEDQRFAILYISERGAGKDGNAVWFRNLSSGQNAFVPVVSDIADDQFRVLDDVGDRFLIQTNRGAPNWKVMLYDPATKAWSDVLREKLEPIEGVTTAGGKLFVTYLKDVSSHAYVYNLAGELENEVQLPGLGTAGGFSGRHEDTFVFYTFTSFNYPTTIFTYDLATKKSAVFRKTEIPGFSPNDYVVEQKFYRSKDGTRVPMFLVHKAGLRRDGANPTVLYGYGGFNIPTVPSFSSLRLAMLEQGLVYASANIRGGGEYGEKWHQAGIKLKKQNVFDDFIAAAESLIADKITSPEKLAIEGGSNGGLLVGAVANQRPELFRAVIESAGVMDMLRFHKFTIGWNWIADYGSSDNEAEFKALRAYSPVHNTTPGVRYPATLITTADHDDRVVPAHAFKYAAALQAAQVGDAPVLIRVDTRSGHGASSTTKAIELTADIDAFIFQQLGVSPKW